MFDADVDGVPGEGFADCDVEDGCAGAQVVEVIVSLESPDGGASGVVGQLRCKATDRAFAGNGMTSMKGTRFWYAKPCKATCMLSCNRSSRSAWAA